MLPNPKTRSTTFTVTFTDSTEFDARKENDTHPFLLGAITSPGISPGSAALLDFQNVFRSTRRH